MSRVMKLSEIAEVVRGVTFDRDSTKSEALAGYVPILRAGNIQDELYLHKDLLWVPKGIVRASCKRPNLSGIFSPGGANWRGAGGHFWHDASYHTNIITPAQ